MPYIYLDIVWRCSHSTACLANFDALRHRSGDSYRLTARLYYPERVQNAMQFVRSFSLSDILAEQRESISPTLRILARIRFSASRRGFKPSNYWPVRTQAQCVMVERRSSTAKNGGKPESEGGTTFRWITLDGMFCRSESRPAKLLRPTCSWA